MRGVKLAQRVPRAVSHLTENRSPDVDGALSLAPADNGAAALVRVRNIFRASRHDEPCAQTGGVARIIARSSPACRATLLRPVTRRPGCDQLIRSPSCRRKLRTAASGEAYRSVPKTDRVEPGFVDSRRVGTDRDTLVKTRDEQASDPGSIMPLVF